MSEDQKTTYDVAVGDDTAVGLTALKAWRWAMLAETKKLPYVVRNSEGDVVAAGHGHVAEGTESEDAFNAWKAAMVFDYQGENTPEAKQAAMEARAAAKA